MNSKVVIIGAGPAGLTAGVELVRQGHPGVVIVEATGSIGGLSQTVNYQGNRIDIGGHRFFSKSDWVMDWWRNLIPISRPPDLDAESFRVVYRGAQRLLGQDQITATEEQHDVMLVRNRLSRILYGGQFFDYPLSPGLATLSKLGVSRSLIFGSSYAAARAFPIKPEVTLEDFFINRFGRRLYGQFFKDYTEKVWGVPCSEISAAWGAQRIKSLSIGKVIAHSLRRGPQLARETSLVEHFLYPKYGPGQMWEMAAERFKQHGGRLVLQAPVVRIDHVQGRVSAVICRRDDGSELHLSADHVISSMPISSLAVSLAPALPVDLAQIGEHLQYRDFITVGLLYRKLRPSASARNSRNHLLPDNWIYVQDPGRKVGRVQIFNNWSPWLVADPTHVWVGLEFFAAEGDELWGMGDVALKELALREMQELGIADQQEALDGVVIRMPKAYPAYFGQAYQNFDRLRTALDRLVNLYLVGRNGMHRYNNQDHSMLTARIAATSVLAGGGSKQEIWDVNIDDEYHEEHR